MVKQEMTRANVDTLGKGELKWTEWANLIQVTLISTTLGKSPLEEMQ